MVQFDSPNGFVRPIRLCEKTRQFAFDSLHHMYGLDTYKTRAVPMDDIEGFMEMDDLDKYDLMIDRVAERAPVRICPDEMLSGAATTAFAINHQIPGSINNHAVMRSVSHLTVDFPKVLKIGINGIKALVEESAKTHTSEREVRFLQSCRTCLKAFDVYHRRYLDALKDRPGYERNYQNLLRVPMEPPRNFYEAVQSLWFTFAFIRHCGNWPGFGRIDEMLNPYLEKDLADGALTICEAREILAHFFIKGCEWICGGEYGSGDAQHYQNLVLSGINSEGKDVTGPVTYLVLDILEETGISDFPTTVRLNKNTDPKLLRRVAEVMRFGGGMLAVYNEDLILKSMTEFGYPLEEARKFANDGCWEVQVPGKTQFGYKNFDSLLLLQSKTLRSYEGGVNFDTFEEFLEAYKKDMDDYIEDFIFKRTFMYRKTGSWNWYPTDPCTVVSLFETPCVERAASYYEGGTQYSVFSPHIGGFADTVNALYAFKKLVYDEKKVTFAELNEILKNDWKDHEPLRLYAKNHYKYFGNDNDEVDDLAADISHSFHTSCIKHGGKKYPIWNPSGVSTFGRQIEWSKNRLASPHGYHAGKVLAGNMNPTPGTDTQGATALIRSYCKCNLAEHTTGAALDLPILPSSVKGEDGLQALIGLMRGFLELGGFFMQLDIMDAELLKQAQERPEDYQTLSVRVSGWNARFVTLCKEWQDMVIERDQR